MNHRCAYRTLEPLLALLRAGVAVALGLLVALLWAVPVAAEEPVPTDATDAAQVTINQVQAERWPEVTVNVTATDAEGRPLTGLQAEQFQLLENGQRQGSLLVSTLEREPVPIGVVLAIDTSGSMRGDAIVAAREAAKTFVAALRDGDQAALLSFNTVVEVGQPFTGDHDALNAAIDELSAGGDTALYDAVMEAASSIGGVSARLAIVVLSDGVDTASTGTLEGAIDAARGRGVPVFPIGLGDKLDEEGLQRLARESGGRYYHAATAADLDYVYRLLSRQLQDQYRLTYRSTTPLDDASVQVRLVVSLPTGGAAEAAAEYLIPATAFPPPTPTPTARPTATSLPTPTTTPAATATPVARALAGVAAPPTATPVLPRESMLAPRRQELLDLFPWVAAAATTLFVLLLLLGAHVGSAGGLLRSRLKGHVDAVDALTVPEEERTSFAQRVARPALRSVSRLALRFLPASQLDRMQQNLTLAGNPYRMRLADFVGMKVVLAVLLGAAGLAYAALLEEGALAVVLVAVAALLGFYLPNAWLGLRIARRKTSILRSLPDAIDLLTLSVEAGLGFDAALLEIVQKWRHPLAQEFERVLAEMQVGRPRKDAMKDMVARTGVPEVSHFVTAIAQAEQLGVPIVRVLRVQAGQIRISRRHRAQEMAHKAPVKMVIPMVLLILPALFAVILGPLVPEIFRVFGGR